MFDIPGVFILLITILLFSFLNRRASKLKNGFLKWTGVIISGLLDLVAVLLLIMGLIGFYKLNQRYDYPVASTPVERTSARIARGEMLAHICMGCHSPNEQLPLSGANLLARFSLPPIGTIYAPNLTPSGNIKDWTDGELIRAIREGVHKDGRSLLFMPANDFRFLSDDDVQAVVAYLRSQPAVGSPTPDNHLNLVGALLVNAVNFKTVQLPVGHITAPQPGTPQYGDYLVSVIGCRGCHGKQLQGRPRSPIGGPSGPNLTIIVPHMTEDQFMTLFNTGQLPDGSTVPVETFGDGLKGPVMPWTEFRAATTDEDLKAIYQFLHSLQPVKGP